jgi:glycosyltransferase involved in cell wall biosynthesis
MVKVAILNNFLGTLGGGERACCALAHCLASMGFSVDLVTFEEFPPSREQLEQAFGPGHSGYSIVRLQVGPSGAQEPVLTEFLRGYTVFINHAAGNSVRNPCPLGIYMVMFPFQDRGAYVDTYHYFLANSEFTAFYTRQRWGHHLNVSVLYPCSESFGVDESQLGPREPEIVTVGRFNIHGHNKNQALLVEAFKRALPMMPPGWRLTLMGRVNPGHETAEYIQRLKEECRNLPVRFELDASEHAKQEALCRATMYWSGTGIGMREPHDAFRMEHFGISIVEGMAAGCIPLCYARGGPREIVEPGVSGFLYDDIDALATFSSLVASNPKLRQKMQRAAYQRSQRFSRACFERGVQDFFRSVVAL